MKRTEKSLKQISRETGVNFSTLHRRIRYYGFTLDEAINCPSGVPLWMYRIEQDEGQQMVDLLRDAASAACETGYTLADLAREWGVNSHTLQHWSKKWGVEWPRGASWVQREKARELIGEINARRKK